LPSFALPASNDLAEEVLRGEIFTEAISPFDGKEINSWEYSLSTKKIDSNPFAPQLNKNIRNLIFLLQLRLLLKTLTFQ
jgi:hypothetical protein